MNITHINKIDERRKMFRTYEAAFHGPQVVTHDTYGTSTMLTPEQFAIYEVAMKARYTHQMIGLAINNYQAQEILGCMTHYQRMAQQNGIELPFIKDEWGQDECNKAAQDYDWAVACLQNDNGIDVDTKKPRNLYKACLD